MNSRALLENNQLCPTPDYVDLCARKAAGFFKEAADEKGRVVWLVTSNGVNVNREQVRRGLAKVNPHRNTDPELPGLDQDKTTGKAPFNWLPENAIPGEA